jgi:hypothetical protein
MKIIFLDIDGVLNSVQSVHMYYRQWLEEGKPEGCRSTDKWCPIAVSNLKMILEECPDAKIVISSTWRLGDGWCTDVKEYFGDYGLDYSRVIGKTPDISKIAVGKLKGEYRENGHHRGHEIQQWLDENTVSPEGSLLTPRFEISDFVIIDDDADMVHLKEKYLYKTDNRHGLTFWIASAIIDRFNNYDPDKSGVRPEFRIPYGVLYSSVPSKEVLGIKEDNSGGKSK